jgi:hypothetical protein
LARTRGRFEEPDRPLAIGGKRRLDRGIAPSVPD